MATPPVNLLVFLTAVQRQAHELMPALTRARFYFTEIHSTGGLMQDPTVFLMIGLDKERVDEFLTLVRKFCQPQKEFIPAQLHGHPGSQPGSMHLPMIEARVGGALVYVLEVEQFEQF